MGHTVMLQASISPDIDAKWPELTDFLLSFSFTPFFRFGKSNAAYMGWIVIGILGGEVVYGKFTDVVWASVNSGRTFDSVDWTKFVVEDDDEDEDDEDEEGAFC
jgi:hypothetical protein